MIDRPLMFDSEQRALQAQLAYYAIPWITDRPPPGPGTYLVTVSLDIHDTGERSYSVRMERWNGERWATKGAYARVESWWFMPQAWQPHAPDCLSLDNVLGRHGCDCR